MNASDRVLFTMRCVVCKVAYAYERMKLMPNRGRRKHWGAGVPV